MFHKELTYVAKRCWKFNLNKRIDRLFSVLFRKWVLANPNYFESNDLNKQYATVIFKKAITGMIEYDVCEHLYLVPKNDLFLRMFVATPYFNDVCMKNATEQLLKEMESGFYKKVSKP